MWWTLGVLRHRFPLSAKVSSSGLGTWKKPGFPSEEGERPQKLIHEFVAKFLIPKNLKILSVSDYIRISTSDGKW